MTEKQKINYLHYLSIFLYGLSMLYVFKQPEIAFIKECLHTIANMYKTYGFVWEGVGGYMVTAALILSFSFNGLRRFLEAILFGWPRFKEYEWRSFTHTTLMLIGYGIMSYFAIGFFGNKHSTKPPDFLDATFIFMFLYIFGYLVNLVDDFISAIYIILFKRGR